MDGQPADRPEGEVAEAAVERLSMRLAAQEAGVDVRTLRRWIRKGLLAVTVEPGPFGPQNWVTREALQAAEARALRGRPAAPPAAAPPSALPPRLEALFATDRAQRAELLAVVQALRAELAQLRTARRPWWERLWRHWHGTTG